MQKSEKRLALESRLNDANTEYNAILRRMLEEELGGLETALHNTSFTDRMQQVVGRYSEIRRSVYRELEDLEREEGFPAMHAYATELDLIADRLPSQNREFCYYPFSGVDFHWARIFDKIVFEDIGFNQEEGRRGNLWWDFETYGHASREAIISTLRAQRIVPNSAILEIVGGDVDVSEHILQFNNPQSTLLLKGPPDISHYFEGRFQGQSLEYGAIITSRLFNAQEKIEDRFVREGYQRHFKLEGQNLLVPYTTELKDVHIFLKA